MQKPGARLSQRLTMDAVVGRRQNAFGLFARGGAPEGALGRGFSP